jgi:anti-sigma regulatory factor (Ser/Thr protein kinase)
MNGAIPEGSHDRLTATVCCDAGQECYGTMTVHELRQKRRDLAASLGLLLPASATRRLIQSHIEAVDAELCRRRVFEATYSADPRQVRTARHAVAEFLADFPVCADDAGLAISELAANSVLHSRSRDSGEFTVRAEIHQDYIWIECEDDGGPWHSRRADDGDGGRGLQVVEGLCGADHWGVDELTDGHRVVWARLAIP